MPADTQQLTLYVSVCDLQQPDMNMKLHLSSCIDWGQRVKWVDALLFVIIQ